MAATPLLALWRHEDARAAVVDFLPTETIAVLAVVAKPLRDAQSRLLLTAIKRRGKTLPSPPTTRACLDTLIVGETHYFCEKWERGLEEWRWINNYRTADDATVEPFHGVGSCLELNGAMSHRGFARRHTPGGVAVGYALLCGPRASTSPQQLGYDATSDFIGGPKFRLSPTEHGVISLIWFYLTRQGPATQMLVEDVAPNTPYIVDATFNHESVSSCLGTVDISVDGETVARGLPVAYNPLSSIHLYNYSRGTSRIGDIEIWSERAAPNQVWKNGPNHARAAV